MIDLDDKKWKFLNGGYRTWYDASVLLKELEIIDEHEITVAERQFSK